MRKELATVAVVSGLGLLVGPVRGVAVRSRPCRRAGDQSVPGDDVGAGAARPGYERREPAPWARDFESSRRRVPSGLGFPHCINSRGSVTWLEKHFLLDGGRSCADANSSLYRFFSRPSPTTASCRRTVASTALTRSCSPRMAVISRGSSSCTASNQRLTRCDPAPSSYVLRLARKQLLTTSEW